MPDKKIQDELDELNLQEAREVAQERQERRSTRKSRAEAIQLSLKRDREHQEMIQAGCAHRKGGKGTAQIYQGNDPNYAVVTHTMAHGPTIVVCQRCGKLWAPPEPLAKNATPAQKTEYREQLAQYRYARNLPTDNEPSGTVLFAFTPTEEAA
jgi:hypothetical protein